MVNRVPQLWVFWSPDLDHIPTAKGMYVGPVPMTRKTAEYKHRMGQDRSGDQTMDDRHKAFAEALRELYDQMPDTGGGLPLVNKEEVRMTVSLASIGAAQFAAACAVREGLDEGQVQSLYQLIYG